MRVQRVNGARGIYRYPSGSWAAAILAISPSTYASSFGSGYTLLDDFFVHNLLAVEPPDWNRLDKPAAN